MFLVLKIIGSFMLVGASFSVGCIFSKNLYRRRDFLKSFIVFLSSLSTHIRYDPSDIFTLVSMCANTDELSCFDFDDKHFLKPFDELWIEKVKSVPNSYSLTKDDKQLLFEFGTNLGKTDVEGQIKHIELYKISFAKQLSQSEEAIVKKSKLYKTMGFFVGTAAALIMI